ncbi:STAS domain-containing protein [Hamadaea tsunoensis]|uniref:STAS domain-containing protein n=1 Tax=Hamadaea tsunoensis TaxID=53368 RepID=UPI000684BDB9|nr:STAS domain-containing protein [Hamadaea tsunoensis]
MDIGAEAGPEPVLILRPALDPTDVPVLYALVVAALADATAVVCDVSAVERVDARLVEVLARLQLTARHHGGAIRVRGAGPGLLRLLAFTGLAEVIPVEAPG